MDDQTLRPAVGSKEAGYLFEFREDGVYLTIYPDAADGLAFELSDIRQVLHDHGVIDYDIITLSQILREAAGEPRRLLNRKISRRSRSRKIQWKRSRSPRESSSTSVMIK